MKHQKIWSTSVQMQSRSSKGSVLSNSCSFLLLPVCSVKDSLLRMAQPEWLSLDFILVHGHASFSSERGAEKHSREEPSQSSLPLSYSLARLDRHTSLYTHSLTCPFSILSARRETKQLNRPLTCSHTDYTTSSLSTLLLLFSSVIHV